MNGTLIFKNDLFRIETKCSPGKELFIIVKTLGDKNTYKDGVKSEWITTVRCDRQQEFISFVKHLVVKRTSNQYEPKGSFKQSSTYKDQRVTETIGYSELVEKDPKGDYELTYDTVLVDKKTGKIIFKGEVKFRISRKDLVKIAKALMAQLIACCKKERKKERKKR